MPGLPGTHRGHVEEAATPGLPGTHPGLVDEAATPGLPGIHLAGAGNDHLSIVEFIISI